MSRQSKGATERSNKKPSPEPKQKRPPDMAVRQIARQIFADDQKEICGYQDVGGPIIGVPGPHAKVAMVTQQYIKSQWHDIPIIVPATRPSIAVPAGADLGEKDASVIELPVGVKKDEPTDNTD